ncbi:uncharacterized protein LOC134830549 isoform X2 [Culicoides brevitarsis]|uniref:uncharacterized protein LOC134830549 isoform X2 n=1 Tax=Culicoides brevitarsis TaxID=469753 RepID=UPI00307B19FE
MLSQGVSQAGSIASLSGSSETISDESNNNQQERLNKRNSFGGSSSVSNSKSKKPPWRTIINPAPPPKPDKQAMLKAKMLDVTRRAIIKQRMQGSQSVSVQTDPLPTKCMKDVSIDQKGLIVLKDQGNITDGNVMIKTETGKFILTNSVAILTDIPLTEDAATQTALPKSEVDFRQFIEPDIDAIRREVDEICNESKTNREKQKKDIDELLRKFKGSEEIPEIIEPEDELESIDSLDISQNDANSMKSRLASYEATLPRRPNLNTYAHWTNLEFPEAEIPPSLPRRTQSDGVAPWKNFKDVILGDRLGKMSLPPITAAPLQQEKIKKRTNCKTVSWSDSHQRAVNDLINEATSLIHVFDQISLLLGPNLGNLAQIPSIEALTGQMKVPVTTSNKRAEAREACAELQKKLEDFQPMQFAVAPDLPPELQQYATL